MEAQREVVRLSLGQGQPSLNVLSAGREGETLSLVCPFPVLPLDVPVSVTLPGDGGRSMSGVLRRVGVELAEETGLPRFKLQLTLVEQPPEAATATEPGISVELDELGDEPWASGEAAPAGAHEDGPVATEIDEFNWPSSEELLAAEQEQDDAWDDGPDEAGEVALGLDDDPPWASSGFESPAIPDEPVPRRRGSRAVRAAVLIGLLVSVAAVAWVMRQQIEGLVRPYLENGVSLAGLGLEAPAAAAAARPVGPVVPPAIEPPEGAALEQDAAEVADDEEPVLEPFGGAALAPGPEGLDEQAEPDGDDRPEVATGGDGTSPAVQDTGERLRVTLPTQWPVSEARSYRIHDPTGIVVDVPGGTEAQAARWIDTSHDRVRSVRVLEREGGVRFIIYLNDEAVPRYRVGYSRSGVTVDILGPDPRHVAS